MIKMKMIYDAAKPTTLRRIPSYLLLRLLIFTVILSLSLGFLVNASALTVNLSSQHPIKVSADYVKISPDGKLAVCYNSSSVYAFNKSGILWRKDVRATCIDVGKYVAVGENGEVLLLALNGSALWHKKVEGSVSSIAIYNGSVVAGTDRGYIYYFNNSGGIIWKYKCKYVTNVGVKKNFVAVTDIDGNLYYFEKCENLPWKYTAGDKTLDWMYKTGWCIWEYEGIANSYIYPTLTMSVTNKSVILACEEMRRVFCFSREGYLEWVKTLNDNPISISASSNGEYIAIGCQKGNVYMFDESGSQLWNVKFGSSAYVSVSPDGKYTAIGSGNSVYVFNSNGRLLWATYIESVKGISISNSKYSAIAVIGDSVYFVTPKLNTSLIQSPLKLNTSEAQSKTPVSTPTPTPTPLTTQTSVIPTPTSTQKVQNKAVTSNPILSMLSMLRYLVIVPVIAAVGIILKKKMGKEDKEASKVKSKKGKTKSKAKKGKVSKTKSKSGSKSESVGKSKTKVKKKSKKATLKKLERAKKAV